MPLAEFPSHQRLRKCRKPSGEVVYGAAPINYYARFDRRRHLEAIMCCSFFVDDRLRNRDPSPSSLFYFWSSVEAVWSGRCSTRPPFTEKETERCHISQDDRVEKDTGGVEEGRVAVKGPLWAQNRELKYFWALFRWSGKIAWTWFKLLSCQIQVRVWRTMVKSLCKFVTALKYALRIRCLG